MVITINKPLILVVVLTVAGGVYGYFSSVKNVNPYPTSASPEQAAEINAKVPMGKAWRPWPLWLPSYFVCVVPHRTVSRRVDPLKPDSEVTKHSVVGYGLENFDGNGYAFGGNKRRVQYLVASMGVGALMGLAIAGGIGFYLGWITVRRQPVEEEDA